METIRASFCRRARLTGHDVNSSLADAPRWGGKELREIAAESCILATARFFALEQANEAPKLLKAAGATAPRCCVS